MVAITRQTSGLAILILLTTIVLCTIRLQLHPFAAESAVCSNGVPIWECIVSAVLLFATAIVVNRTAVKMGILGGFGTLPVSLYGFMACGILLSPQMLTASAAGLMTALGIMFLLRVMHIFGNKESVFTGTLFLGVAAVIYPPAAMLGAAIPIAIFVAPLNIRQTILAIVGWVLPIAAVSYVNWYLGGEITETVVGMWQQITELSNIPLSPLPIVTMVIAAVVAILILIGVIMSISYRYTLLVSVRKCIEMEVLLTMVSIAAFFMPGCNITILPVVSVPVSVMLAFTLERLNNRWANYLYGGVVALVIIHLFIY